MNQIKMLTAKEVARIIDCSPDDASDWARKGKIKAFKHGRFWCFRLSDVQAFKKSLEGAHHV
jgi:excisionase family DNA binding protein